MRKCAKRSRCQIRRQILQLASKAGSRQFPFSFLPTQKASNKIEEIGLVLSIGSCSMLFRLKGQ